MVELFSVEAYLKLVLILFFSAFFGAGFEIFLSFFTFDSTFFEIALPVLFVDTIFFGVAFAFTIALLFKSLCKDFDVVVGFLETTFFDFNSFFADVLDDWSLLGLI